MLVVAAAAAVVATLLGLYAAPRLGQDSGALIITFAAVFFFVSLLGRRRT
jgi:ABC-type Mn2+/Zn2+ transport system permease subunit